MHHPLLAPAGLILALSLACANPPPPATVTDSVDLARYAGRWLELARLPAFFQRDCVRSRADYTAVEGGLAVVNHCFTADGEQRRALGLATPVPGSGNAKLRVRFRGFWARLAPVPNEGNYWILHLDPRYRSALVGTPDRRYLWILAREAQREAEYDALVERARAAGYDVERLIRSDWTAR
jgi:apolipoprotein D and lipocalin family protein